MQAHHNGNVVTGTFHHQSRESLNLRVSGSSDQIGVTSNHPIWSATRRQFVPAGELRVGEDLQTLDGGACLVTSITPRGPPEPVYNIEVNGQHVYHVGELGVLVHNKRLGRPGSAIREFDVRPLSAFRGPGTVGDNLTGHELLQSAWLREHLGAGRFSSVGGRNPAIAITEGGYHKLIGELQAEAGLHSPTHIARQSARQNVLENVQILKEAGVPKEAICELLLATRKFIQELGL